MNKVLISGLGVGKEFGVCDSCNLNYDTMLVNPSILLWADKICLPKNLYHSQLKFNDKKRDKAINLLLSMINDENIIEEIDIENMYTPKTGEEIQKTSLHYLNKILLKFPQTVKKGDRGVPDELKIEEESFCGPYIASLHASIKLANDIGANCLLSSRDDLYLKYRYGLEADNDLNKNKQEIYREIFKSFIPNDSIAPEYAFKKESLCNKCKSEQKCNNEYLFKLEKDIQSIMKWREYDEIYQMKEIIEKIILEKNTICNQVDVKEIKEEFLEKQKKINKNINRRFPQIKRWTNLITIVSSPVTMYAAATGNAKAAIVSGASTGAAKIVEKVLDNYTSKNNWVSFYQKNTIEKK